MSLTVHDNLDNWVALNKLKEDLFNYQNMWIYGKQMQAVWSLDFDSLNSQIRDPQTTGVFGSQALIGQP